MIVFLSMAFSLGLIALVAGIGLYIWSLHAQGAGTRVARMLGLAVSTLSIASLVIIIFSSIFHRPDGKRQGLYRNQQMMQPMQDVKSTKPFNQQEKMNNTKKMCKQRDGMPCMQDTDQSSMQDMEHPATTTPPVMHQVKPMIPDSMDNQNNM